MVASSLPLRAVILDFDGVVVDSLPVHLEAWRASVLQVFKQPLPHPERLIGRATRTIAHSLAKTCGDPSRAGELAIVKRQLLESMYAHLPLLAGAREFIEALAAAGTPYGIASNSPRAFVAGAVAALRLHVPVIFAGDDMSRGKPHPDIFWACGNALRVEPSARPCVTVFEDSFHGLKAAVAATMTPIGVASAHTDEALRDAGAIAVCADLGVALARGWHAAHPLKVC